MELVSTSETEAVEHIIRHGKRLRRFNNLLQTLLPSELKAHCQLANIKGNTAVLHVSSTVWATRIRYQIPNIINKLQDDAKGRQITNIEIRVHPGSARVKKEKAVRRASMSKEAALSVQRCAATVDDEKLRSALERLASRKDTN